MGIDFTMGLGSLFGSGMSAAVSAKIASQNRKFQERMTKNRYQYQMADMRSAGLNPMLSMGQQPPASPPGAMAQIPDFGKSFTSSFQAKLQNEQARKVGNEADLIGIQAYVAALGLEGVKGAESLIKDTIDKYGKQMKTSAQKVWKEQTRVPTVPEIGNMLGNPGPRYDFGTNATKVE